MRRAALVFLAILTVSGTAWAGDGIFDEFFGYYMQRTEGVTAGAGNAQAANSAIHTADPWPPGAGNRRIPASGERMSRAIRRYQDVTKLREAAPPPVPDGIGTSGIGVGPTSYGK